MVPQLAYPLVALGAAEAVVGAGGGDDPSGLTSPGEIPAREPPPGEVTSGQAC